MTRTLVVSSGSALQVGRLHPPPSCETRPRRPAEEPPSLRPPRPLCRPKPTQLPEGRRPLSTLVLVGPTSRRRGTGDVTRRQLTHLRGEGYSLPLGLYLRDWLTSTATPSREPGSLGSPRENPRPGSEGGRDVPAGPREVEWRSVEVDQETETVGSGGRRYVDGSPTGT